MTKELRRVSVVVVLMFLTLFGSTTIIQALQADNLKADGRNTRTLYASFSTQRGDISAGTTRIATSVPANDVYKFQRQYANGPLYAPVTGYTVLFGEPRGIEGALNGELAGTGNSQFLQRLNQIITGQDARGADVQLTIDPALQQTAWDALGDQRGAVVAIEPSTGRILAMVSKPSYDPNTLAVHDTKQANAAYDALVADTTKPLVNRTINGDLYAPGSTFKLIVATTALESGKYTADSTFPNPATFTLPGTNSVINNAEGGACGGGAEASIATALRLSCNIPFAQLGAALGQDAIRSQAEKFGFGDKNLRVPMKVTPSQYPENDSEAQTMLSSFGQANDRVTPLQMAMVSAAIGNGGSLMQPTLVQSVTSSDLQTLQSFSAKEYSRPMSQDTASTMTTMMIADVANGAASNARINGIDVAGKTGTAENGKTDPYTLWFTGFAPAQNPKVAVAVVLENGGGQGQNSFGNRLAAPIAKKVMEAVVSK
jgi:penicillin-binding protein A